MNFNLELQKRLLDVSIDVGSNIDLNAITKGIYVVVDIYTNDIVVTTIIIDTTVVMNPGSKDAHWDYFVRGKFKNLGLRQPNVALCFPILPTIYFGKI